jgi:hypothetical protein
MRALVVAVVLAAVGAAPARAADGDYCVGVVRAGCSEAASVQAALARPDRAHVYVGDGRFDAAALSDGGTAVTITGAGPAATTLGALRLDSPASRVEAAGFSGALRVAGRAERVDARAGVDLLPGPDATGTAQLAQATVTGTVRATGPGQLDDVDVGGRLAAVCATVLGRGVAVSGTTSATCSGGGTAAVELRSCVLTGEDPVAHDAAGTVTTAFCIHADDADATATGRLDPGSSPVDAGDPAPLAPFEPFEDAAGDLRVTDGDGDGVLRRDAGPYERQPPPVPAPAGNVLVDGGAEAADVVLGGPPPGWTGSFTAEAYGAPSLPGARAGAALGGGRAFFSAASAPVADLLQRIDLTASARAIDAGGATAALSGLLGGYGADGDRVTVTAAFRDPEGATIGTLTLGPVTPDERARSTTLLHRETAGAIPVRTRAIDVTVHGERVAGSYTDAYADELALVLSVPGVPVDPPVQPDDPIVSHLRPFAGVTVLTPRPRFSRRWRAPVAVACPSATVGRCSARLELRAKLPGATSRGRIAHFAYVSEAPGTVRRVVLRMLVAPRRPLRHRRTLRARIITVARDTQGLQRRRTVPVRLRLPAAHRRR